MKYETRITINRLDYGGLLIIAAATVLRAGNAIVLGLGPPESAGLLNTLSALVVSLISGLGAILLFIRGFVRIYQWYRAWRAAP